MLPEFRTRVDLVKFVCLASAIILPSAVVYVVPSLSAPVLLSIAATLLVSPLVSGLEKRGLSRSGAIGAVFACLFLAIGLVGYLATLAMVADWDSFCRKIPVYFDTGVEHVRTLENDLKARYSFLSSMTFANSLTFAGRSTGRWFMAHGADLVGNLATCLFLVPFITFVLLRDGVSIRKRFFGLVPNRFFEASFMISTKITTALSDYLQAKLAEAALVGLITLAGLLFVGAPYAFVLSLASGVTNIVPYLGPFLGLAPAVLVTAFESTYSHLLWPVVTVFAIANVVDTFLIFPILVAKLVNLHPLLLIITVMIGQQYYGVVGMLISIPVATGLKVIIQEIYSAVYQSGGPRRGSLPI